jgi:hypothetical protein
VPTGNTSQHVNYVRNTARFGGMRVVQSLNLTRDTHGKRIHVFYGKLMSAVQGVFIPET